MSHESKNLVIFLLLILSLALSVFCAMRVAEVMDLKKEREAYQWRNFTCKTLLDDPVIRKIMCVRGTKGT